MYGKNKNKETSLYYNREKLSNKRKRDPEKDK